MAAIAFILITLPLYGLLVLTHVRYVKRTQLMLNDALAALRLVGRKYG